MMTFLNLEAWNRIADCAIRERCEHIHWFLTPPAVEESDAEASADAPEKTKAGGAS